MNSRIKTLRPLLNRCLIRRILPEQKTKGGIILSERSTEKDARFGEVVATGPGSFDDKGHVLPLSVQVGDRVLLPEYQGTKVVMEDDHEYMLYKDTEILGVVEGYKH